MKSHYGFLVPLALLGAKNVLATSCKCHADNCARAVIGTQEGPEFTSRAKADCSSYVVATSYGHTVLARTFTFKGVFDFDKLPALSPRPRRLSRTPKPFQHMPPFVRAARGTSVLAPAMASRVMLSHPQKRYASSSHKESSLTNCSDHDGYAYSGIVLFNPTILHLHRSWLPANHPGIVRQL